LIFVNVKTEYSTGPGIRSIDGCSEEINTTPIFLVPPRGFENEENFGYRSEA